MTNKDKKKIDELLSRGVSEVIDKENLRKKLLSGKKLIVKLGIDPTSRNLHLGRSIPLLKLKDFQELGHQIVFIIGDFTGVVGDTSDKDSERPMLEDDAIKTNMETYAKQVGKILDMKKTIVERNSKWLSKLGYKELSKQMNIFSLADFIARENISKRLKEEKRVSLREIIYPLMQGYDSVAIKADVELGGTDQRFNLLSGREMQKHYNQEPQDILMTNLIEGIDGRKMSSSWGNTINLTDGSNDMFGKVMRLNDSLIIKYFVHCTRVPMEDVLKYEDELKSGKNPRDVKMILAEKITEMYWSKKESQKAKDFFVSAFQKKEIDFMPEKDGAELVRVSIKNKNWTYLDLVLYLINKGKIRSVKNKSEVVRLFDQQGIRLVNSFINLSQDRRVEEVKEILKKNDKIQDGWFRVGKREFFCLKISDKI